jgi:hypothetical protein
MLTLTEQQLMEMGFVHTYYPAEWEDVGGPENGPDLQGHDEYSVWTLGQAYIVVQDGAVVEAGRNPPEHPAC